MVVGTVVAAADLAARVVVLAGPADAGPARFGRGTVDGIDSAAAAATDSAEFVTAADNCCVVEVAAVVGGGVAVAEERSVFASTVDRDFDPPSHPFSGLHGQTRLGETTRRARLNGVYVVKGSDGRYRVCRVASLLDGHQDE